jgi:hypothetical protein
MLGADIATKYLRVNPNETTTASMPYWDGCSVETELRHKNLYAFSQFMATLACIWASNPALPFSVLMAIQFASFLMTLSRKGFITTRSSHMAYSELTLLSILNATVAMLFRWSAALQYEYCVHYRASCLPFTFFSSFSPPLQRFRCFCLGWSVCEVW